MWLFYRLNAVFCDLCDLKFVDIDLHLLVNSSWHFFINRQRSAKQNNVHFTFVDSRNSNGKQRNSTHPSDFVAFKRSGSDSQYIIDISNPVVITGGAAVVLLILILVTIIVILVYFHRSRIRRQNQTTRKDISLIEAATNEHVHSNSYLKTCHFVNDLDEPNPKFQRHFSEPDFNITIGNHDGHRPSSWPIYSESGKSLSDSICSLFRYLFGIRDENDDNFSNSMRIVDDCRGTVVDDSSQRSDSGKEIHVYRKPKGEHPMTVIYTPLLKAPNTDSKNSSD